MYRIGLVLTCTAMLATPAICAAQDTAAEQAVPAYLHVGGSPQCRGAQGYSADFGGARTFLWRPQWVEAVTSGDSRESVLRAAEAALSRGPYSVTDKPNPIPSATANDYASIGPYWWPDPNEDDGLPYVRRDGEVNPERDGPEFDKTRLRDLSEDLKALALGYHANGDERFAVHAAELVRTWFIVPDTAMLPRFEFAQGIPGRVNGRGEGIIEASHLSTIVEALGLLSPSAAIPSSDHRAVREWYTQFVVWMATSEIGETEMQKHNNHSVFYDFYLAHFALYAGAEGAARNVVKAFPEYRLGVQMDRQGRFIEELRRTRSWHYSHYVVDGAARLSTIGECVGLDLWSARLADGRGMHSAIAFLDRYAAEPETWPFPDTDLARGRIERMQERSRRIAVLVDRDINAETVAELP